MPAVKTCDVSCRWWHYVLICWSNTTGSTGGYTTGTSAAYENQALLQEWYIIFNVKSTHYHVVQFGTWAAHNLKQTQVTLLRSKRVIKAG